MTITTPRLVLCTALLASAPALHAQTFTDGAAAGSLTFFLEARAAADGGSAASATYALTATIGEPAPDAAASATYAVAGGFPAILDADSTAPWLVAASPSFVTPRNPDTVWLSGTRLALTTPDVTLSGRATTLVAQSNQDVAVRLPSLPAPGYHELALRNIAGTTTLERGIAVLPLLYTDGPAAPDTAFDVVFKGTKGDMVVWTIARGPGPLVPVPPYLHGINFDLTAFTVLPPVSITADSGEFRFPVPAIPLQFSIFVQGLFITNNPGYAPGSFSNVLQF